MLDLDYNNIIEGVITAVLSAAIIGGFASIFFGKTPKINLQYPVRKKNDDTTIVVSSRNGGEWKIYKGKDGYWWWCRTAPNGRILGASSESYTNKSDCIKNARRNGLDLTNETKSGDRWEIYKDNADAWRWRRIAQSGQIIGASSENYKNKSDCIANAQRHGMTRAPA